jgi:putative endonuclease
MADSPGSSGRYWVYILQVRGGSYYTGCTSNLARRYRQHQAGRCRFTRGFPPVAIAQCWTLRGGRSAAMRVESLIKRMQRRGKEAIVRRPDALIPAVRRELGAGVAIEPAPPEGWPPS